jgi:phage repressor protein C with HTH and peptisase S24 domain
MEPNTTPDSKLEVNERFKQVVEYMLLVDKSLSKTSIAQQFGISKSKLSEILNNRMMAGVDMLNKLVLYYNVNSHWLLTGEGSMFLKDVPAGVVQHTAAPAAGIPLIPIDALAGVGMGELVITEHDIEQRYVVPEFEKAEFLIRVKGSSMYPKYNAGDLLACRRVAKTDFIQWNKTYVLDTTQGILVKRILKGTHNNHWILRSDNKDYLDIDVEPEQHVHGISLVIGVIRLE